MAASHPFWTFVNFIFVCFLKEQASQRAGWLFQSAGQPECWLAGWRGGRRASWPAFQPAGLLAPSVFSAIEVLSFVTFYKIGDEGSASEVFKRRIVFN